MTDRSANPANSLPDFCNLGVVLRSIILVMVCCFAAAAVRKDSGAALVEDFVETSAFVVPLLLASLVVLCPVCRLLQKTVFGRSALLGWSAVLLIELLLVAALLMYSRLYGAAWDNYATLRIYGFAALLTLALLAYFRLWQRAFSPALAQARLQALQARIRPHFLFNSINAVLSLIRAEPKRAEGALQDMADLFRVLMADNQALTLLKNELTLCRQYLALEKLRLGDRLQVDWQVDALPEDALIPPLVLQPLLENAVYHGIEPRLEPGLVTIRIHRDGEKMHAVLSNPYQPAMDHHDGNRMALANIRERLALHFDVEARLKTESHDGAYQVHITWPYRTR